MVHCLSHSIVENFKILDLGNKEYTYLRFLHILDIVHKYNEVSDIPHIPLLSKIFNKRSLYTV